MQQTQSSEQITPTSETPAEDVEKIVNILGHGSKPEANPQTPSFRSPAESQIMKAIMDANTECLREWLEPVLPAYQWEIIQSLGEADRGADPGEQMLKASIALLILNWARKVDGNTHEVITTLLGAESTHFSHCSERCQVRLDR